MAQNNSLQQVANFVYFGKSFTVWGTLFSCPRIKLCHFSLTCVRILPKFYIYPGTTSIFIVLLFMTTVFTARAYARAVLGVVILSVRLSVCLSDAWIVTKLNDALQIFYTTRKGNHSATLIPRVVGWRRPLPSEICVQSDLPPFEKRRLRPISAHNVSTVGDSEKSSITTNIKSTTSFPTSHRWSAYVTPKCPNGWLKERLFSLFGCKSTADRLKCCQLRSPVSVINNGWSAATLIAATVRDLYLAARPSRRNGLFTI